MRPPEKRRSRSRWSALVADPYRKLLAIALAIGLWYFLDAQITSTVRVRMQLEVVDVASQNRFLPNAGSRLQVLLPTDKVTKKRFSSLQQTEPVPIEHVDLVVTGPRYLVDKVDKDRLVLSMTAFQSLGWDRLESAEFSVSDIVLAERSLQGTTVVMDPPRVRIDVERIEYRDVALDLDKIEIDIDPLLRERLRRETVEFSRERVRVLGPASSLKGFPGDNPPFVARLQGSGNEKQLTAALELNAASELRLRMQDPCSLTVRLRPSTRTFALELPFQVDDLALPPDLRGRYRPESPTRKVRIKAAGDLRSRLVTLEEDADPQRLATWAMAHLRLLVFLPPEEDRSTYGQEIVLEARLQLLGPLQSAIDAADYTLADTVTVTLRRTP